MAYEATIKAMKEWCLANYEKCGYTMVECWDTDDYPLLIEDDHKGDEAAAWQTLKNVAAVYEDRRANARNEAF